MTILICQPTTWFRLEIAHKNTGWIAMNRSAYTQSTQRVNLNAFSDPLTFSSATRRLVFTDSVNSLSRGEILA